MSVWNVEIDEPSERSNTEVMVRKENSVNIDTKVTCKFQNREIEVIV